MKKLALMVLFVLPLTACQDEVGSAGWCDSMNQKPKTEWSAQNAMDFAKHCIFQEQVGSKAWCEYMDAKPKGDWTANEAKSYATNCIF